MAPAEGTASTESPTRQRRGVGIMCRRNTSFMWLWLAKPQARAISTIGSRVFKIIAFARSTRRAINQRCGGTPVVARNARAKWDGERAATEASARRSSGWSRLASAKASTRRSRPAESVRQARDTDSLSTVRSSLIPIVTLSGINLALLINSSVAVETVFGWPGIGTLLFDSIAMRDFPMAQGIVVVIGVFIILCNFVIDVLYAYIDPRIRLAA